MQHQAQSPAASLSSKSASLVDDDDSSDSQEGEQASVAGVESNDGLNDGLSKYERQRQERVDRNNQRLFELGLGPPVSAGGRRTGIEIVLPPSLADQPQWVPHVYSRPGLGKRSMLRR